ncbi:MAG TPA: lanthionine synthetase C family protein [Chitinophaga sp.]
MDQAKQTGKVLQQISQVLDSFIEQEPHPGLLSGYSGTALFYAYYYNLTGKKKHLKKVHQVMLKSLQALSEEEMILSHCSGVAGIAWCIQHLMQTGFAEGDGMQDIFEEADSILGDFMETDLRNNKYDFLHEGLGITLYFLERYPHPTAEKYLTEVVLQLEKNAKVNAPGISWKDHFSRTSQELGNQDCFNLGLAHGVPAIITILGMIYEKGIAADSALTLIDRSVAWLLALKNEPETGVTSMYPSLVGVNNEALHGKQSRLGWCYGDLGIAITLWNTGHRTQKQQYRQAAYDIFEHTIKHRDKKNGSVNDACLCHGSAGIAQIFHRASLATGDALLAQGAAHWTQQTLQMNTWEDGPAGYKFFHSPTYENCYNLLEGITGIGLSLIASLDKDTNPAWDRCLLLS